MKAAENPRGLILRASRLWGGVIGATALERQDGPFSGVLGERRASWELR